MSTRTKTVKGLLQCDVGCHTGIFNRSWIFLWCASSSGPRIVIFAMLSPDLASGGAVSTRKTLQMTMPEETSFDPLILGDPSIWSSERSMEIPRASCRIHCSSFLKPIRKTAVKILNPAMSNIFTCKSL